MKETRDRYHTNPKGNEQTDDAYWRSLFYFAYDGPTVQNKTNQYSLSQLTYGLSDMEHYFYELEELNRSLNVHYQGRIIQKGGGRKGVYALNLVYAQRMKNGYQLNQNCNESKK